MVFTKENEKTYYSLINKAQDAQYSGTKLTEEEQSTLRILSDKKREHEKEIAEQKKQNEMNAKKKAKTFFEKRKDECYKADINDNTKFVCPECKWEEGGLMRLIPHKYDCKNNGKQYCQRYDLGLANYMGGKRKSKKTMKARKHKKGTYRKRR